MEPKLYKRKQFVLIFLINLRCSVAISHASYISLITQLHYHYETSCIVMLHLDDTGFDDLTGFQRTMRHFSMESIFSAIMDGPRWNRNVTTYNNKPIPRPLVTVFFESQEMVVAFSKITENTNVAFPVWLLVFEEDVYTANFDGANVDNIFHLTFDTTMIVAVENSRNIREWYAIRNETRRVDYARWHFGSKLVFLSNGNLHRRRMNLENSSFVVGIVDNPPLIMDENQEAAGYYVAVLLEIANILNFSIEFVRPNESTFGSWNEKRSEWTGLVGMLQRGEADMGITDMLMTVSRSSTVDFTHPFVLSRSAIYIKQPTFGIRWSGYLEAFSTSSWTAIVVMIFSTTIVSMLIGFVNGETITQNVVTEHLLIVVGLFCQQVFGEPPDNWPLRIAYFSILVATLVISAAYSASLVSFLTVTSASLPFSTLEGFANDGTYKLIVRRDGADYNMFKNANDSVLVQMWSLMEERSELPLTIIEGFRQVCENRVAFYTQVARKEAIGIYLPCTVTRIETDQVMSLAMVVAKNFPYYALINDCIHSLHNVGILDRLRRMHLPQTMPVEFTSHSEVTLRGVAPIFAVLAGGLLFAFILLLFERSRTKIYRIKPKPTIKISYERVLKRFRHIYGHRMKMNRHTKSG